MTDISSRQVGHEDKTTFVNQVLSTSETTDTTAPDGVTAGNIIVPSDTDSAHSYTDFRAIPGPDEMPDGPYARAARAYWDAGWQPIPLPSGAKYPPPPGYTGDTAYKKTLTPEQIADWIKRNRLGNVGLRMPRGVVGFDVDDYVKGASVKRGLDTLTQLIDTYGPLPKTVMSTARPGSPGQLMYRMPRRYVEDDYARVEVYDTLPGKVGPGIDAIQNHHRYTVACPSTHPDADGAMYRWYLPDEDYDGTDFWNHRTVAPEGFIPRVEDLPELPEAWLKLTTIGGKSGARTYEGDGGGSEAPLGSYEVQRLLSGMAISEDLDRTLANNIINTYRSAVRSGESRHISCVDNLTWAFKVGAAGLIDPTPVIDTLSSLFASDTSDRHIPGEFAAMVGWAAANGTPGGAAYRQQWERNQAEFKERMAAEREARVADAAAQHGGVWDGQETGNNEVNIPEPGMPEEGDDWPADRLPEAFWNATGQLQKIRQMARARRASPDAVLHAVLARTAAMADPTVRVDGGVRPATLCWYCGLFGPSGSGKGNAENTAEELAPFPAIDYAHIDISTGQGIIAAYLELESDPDDDDGKKKIMIQRRTRGYALATEGSVLDAMSKMNAGATLNTVLCAGWMSERQGTSNATQELRRTIPKGAYTLSMSLGVQEEPAAKLLEMGNIGLPQRLAWAHAALGSDTPEERPETTGPVTVTLRNGEDVPVTTWVSGLRDIDLQVPGHVVKEVDDVILATSFGRGAEFPLDTHEPLWRLKCAALLALLHGRTDVRTEEWDLATVMWETSRKVRDRVQDAAEKRLQSEAAAKRAETVQTAAESQAAVYEIIHGVHPTVANVAKRAHRYLARNGGEVLASKLRESCVAAKDRRKYRESGATDPLWTAALRHGCEQGWLVMIDGSLVAAGAETPA